MCGITGYLSKNALVELSVIEKMSRNLLHRGPDSGGTWVDADDGVALGHRRLSIIELSPAGHQPMRSASGKLVLSFNGEIYNHKEIRSKLEKCGRMKPYWRGNSDTETLLVALEEWGVQKALEELNGMFAFALWDRETKKLTLARDRLGEKPIYYGTIGNSFAFGSELKSLAAHPHWTGEIDSEIIPLYFKYNYIPDPFSIYKGIRKVPAGCYLEVDRDHAVEIFSYWKLSDIASCQKLESSEAEIISTLEKSISRSIALRMEADVPLGVFLSGGIDSSLVTALMQAQSSKPISTFTIGFEAEGYNEAEHAKAIASCLGTQHNELYLSDKDALETIPNLPEIWDEPFSDPSQIPTLLLSRMTREKVTVALSGDGGDEVFYGYERYSQASKIKSVLDVLPSGKDNFLVKILSSDLTESFNSNLASLFPAIKKMAISDKLKRISSIISRTSDTNFYDSFISSDTQKFLASPRPLIASLLTTPSSWPKFKDFRESMMYLDTLTYLPSNILTKVDRSSMSASLEVRSPFLDHQLIELAWKLPISMKIRGDKKKWVIREILNKHVPSALTDRPKKGFSVPTDQWLRGPLKEWAEDLISPEMLKRTAYFDSNQVRKMWGEHQSRTRRWHTQLWTILMFQAWLVTTNQHSRD